ncbi:MAG: cysteine desulfurase [Nitrospirota bacterium]|nr:cysteine desulfurase [Nitrospirota bacterium]
MIYLDNNATTTPAAAVADAVCGCLRENFGNPSSSHHPGEKAKNAIEHARALTAKLIGAKTNEIIFTSGGTEANNLAITGTASRRGPGHIITSATEHPSVLNPLKHLGSLGFSITYLPVDRYGFVDPDDVSGNIRKDTVLITVMHSNNETGTLQPIAEIGRIAKDNGITFHCDAAQSVGKVPINVKRLNIDLLTVVPHKFHGPKGVGALYIKSGTKVSPLLFGASHERGLRPGTENVCSIVGLGMAAELAAKEMSERVSSMRRLTELFHKELRSQIPGIKLNSPPSKRLPNTLNLSFPDITGSALLERLKNDIAASTGSACHEGRHTPSHVLKAMGISDKEAFSAVRFSLGRDNTGAQIEKAVKVIVKAYRSLCS